MEQETHNVFRLSRLLLYWCSPWRNHQERRIGTPAVISIFFFVIYYVISISGQKLVEEDVVGTFTGMWAASYILLPIGIFLTYKATTDSVILNIETYLMFFNKVKDFIYRLFIKESDSDSARIKNDDDE